MPHAIAVPELGTTNTDYIAWLAGIDIRRHWKALSEYRESQAQLWGVPAGQIGFKAIYRCFPHKLDVFDMAPFLTEENAKKDPWLARVAQTVLSCKDHGPRKKELLIIEYWWNGVPHRTTQACRQGYFDMSVINAKSPGNLPCRSGCIGPDDRPMDHSWDEIDEIAHRLYSKQRQARRLGLLGAEKKHVWDYLDASTGMHIARWHSIERALGKNKGDRRG